MYQKNEHYIFKILITFIIALIIAKLCNIYHFRKNYFNIGINSNILNIVTPYNDNDAYHPKVVAFNEPWHGYRYWMAYTPYKNANALNENPTINASNDKINWDTPNGLVNPLDVPKEADKKHYNSDTHLLYNPDTDSLEVFWRYVDDVKKQAIIYKSTSNDGIKWSAKEVFLFSDNRSNRDYVSPAIVYENGNYLIWYVDKNSVHYMELKNNVISNPLKLDIKYKENLITWHIDVVKKKDKYEMIMVAYYAGQKRKTMELYYSSSQDNQKWTTPISILRASNNASTWDSEGLYRSALLIENNKYYIFYSGHNKEYDVGIGLVCGNSIKDLKNCNN